MASLPPEEALAAAGDALHGVVLFIGASDTGKTTLATWLADRLRHAGERVGYLDCDVGQSTVGPPGTLGLSYLDRAGRQQRLLYFLGDTSPRGHLLPAVVGAGRLLAAARSRGCSSVVVDTTGLIDPAAGGLLLKLWKTELLQPNAFGALQRHEEVAPIVAALRPLYAERLLVLSPAGAARPRSSTERRYYREEAWRAYFAGARTHLLDTRGLATWDARLVGAGRIVGLDGADGFCRGVGVLVSWAAGQVRLTLPGSLPRGVRRLRLGHLSVDPSTGNETR
ncbi:MAG: Clp1/GlmU family protein [Anaerolineae bacterium]